MSVYMYIHEKLHYVHAVLCTFVLTVYSIYIYRVKSFMQFSWSIILRRSVVDDHVWRCLSVRFRLKLQSLELRRLVADLLWCYKIVFNVVDISTEEFFCHNTCSYTRGHPFKLFKKRPVSSTMENFFSDRVVNVWNALPAADVDFMFLARFHHSISKVDLSDFVKRF